MESGGQETERSEEWTVGDGKRSRRVELGVEN